MDTMRATALAPSAYNMQLPKCVWHATSRVAKFNAAATAAPPLASAGLLLEGAGLLEGADLGGTTADFPLAVIWLCARAGLGDATSAPPLAAVGLGGGAILEREVHPLVLQRLELQHSTAQQAQHSSWLRMPTCPRQGVPPWAGSQARTHTQQNAEQACLLLHCHWVHLILLLLLLGGAIGGGALPSQPLLYIMRKPWAGSS